MRCYRYDHLSGALTCVVQFMIHDTCHAPGADLALPCLASLLELQDVASLGSEISGLENIREEGNLRRNATFQVDIHQFSEDKFASQLNFLTSY